MSDQYLAEIRVFPYNFAPSGWAFCQGQLQSIAQNNALFAIIGTTYGGDGVSTFGLPDLRDKLAVGIGQGAGLSAWTQGQVAGVPNVTLTIAQVPSHTHQATAGDGVAFAGQTAAPTATSYLGREKGGAYTTSSNTTLANSAVGIAGGSLPHSNLMPVLVMNYNIALQGVFPSRN